MWRSILFAVVPSKPPSLTRGGTSLWILSRNLISPIEMSYQTASRLSMRTAQIWLYLSRIDARGRR